MTRQRSYGSRSHAGELSDYGSFEEAKEYGEVEAEEKFEEQWREEYPDEVKTLSSGREKASIPDLIAPIIIFSNVSR